MANVIRPVREIRVLRWVQANRSQRLYQLESYLEKLVAWRSTPAICTNRVAVDGCWTKRLMKWA